MSAYSHAESSFRDLLLKEHMDAHLSHGALLALSGGKDSVLLLSLLSRYAKEKEIPVAAFHLHHGIRGEEADRDAEFCKELCEELGVSLFMSYVDVPAIAKEMGEGIEATARRERYRLLAKTARERGFSCVLTAHTATDNLETVLLHLLRGGGGNALAGIPPVRPLCDGIMLLRPLLSLSAEEVTAALRDASLPSVFDSTNDDVAYTRNYVRKEILPRLSAITPSPERAVSRMTENVREDMAFLDGVARDAFDTLFDGESLDAEKLARLPRAIRYRVFRMLYEKKAKGAPLPERVHVNLLFDRMMREGDFSFSFPKGVRIGRTGDRLVVGFAPAFSHPETVIHKGCNRLADGSLLFVMEKSSKPLPQIVYTLSIQRPLASATIEGELCVRSRREGDAYRYGGVTHRLKKLFSDAKLSKEARSSLPVLHDARGILWVPGFGVRDDGGDGERDMTLLYIAARDVSDELLKQLD